MIRTLSWKWLIHYGIPLETDRRIRCFVRDRWFLWFCSHSWGSEIQVPSPGPPEWENLGRDADDEFDEEAQPIKRTAGSNQASDRCHLSANAGVAPPGNDPVGQYPRPDLAADREPAEPRPATTPRAPPSPAPGANPALPGGIQTLARHNSR